MGRYYIVKCDRNSLKKLLLQRLGDCRSVSGIVFGNIFRDIVLEQVSREEIDEIYQEFIRECKITPTPNNTCNND